MVNLIRNYINKLSIQDISEYLKNKDIYLDDNELNIVYDYFKNKWYDFLYKNATPILDELKDKICKTNYNKLYELYIWAKEKYSNYL